MEMEKERRKTGGREKPYRELRAVAKIYSILAPLGGAVIFFIGAFSMWANPGPPYAKALGATLLLVMALITYLILKTYSQSIYILFDIAGGIKRAQEVLERTNLKDEPGGN